jgi:hypothetical protein
MQAHAGFECRIIRCPPDAVSLAYALSVLQQLKTLRVTAENMKAVLGNAAGELEQVFSAQAAKFLKIYL